MDFLLSEHRDVAAKRFFTKAIQHNGTPPEREIVAMRRQIAALKAEGARAKIDSEHESQS